MHAIVYYHGSMESACMCMWPVFTWNSVFANNGHAIMHACAWLPLYRSSCCKLYNKKLGRERDMSMHWCALGPG